MFETQDAQATDTAVPETAQASPKTPKAEPVVTPVKMTDGRTVQFSGRSRMLKDWSVLPGGAGVKLTFDFLNGETRSTLIGPDHPLLWAFVGHGASQKAGDESSDAKGSVDDMVLATEAMFQRFESATGLDDWRRVRTGSGDSFAGGAIVLRAFLEATNEMREAAGKPARDLPWAKAFIQKKIDETGQTRQKIYASFKAPGTKVAAIIQRLESEKAAKASVISGDDALAEAAEED